MTRILKLVEGSRYYETARGSFIISHPCMLPNFTMEVAVLKISGPTKCPRRVGKITNFSGKTLRELAEIADQADENFNEFFAKNPDLEQEYQGLGWSVGAGKQEAT